MRIATMNNGFEYHKPATIREAISLLLEYGDKCRLIAGGTDVVASTKDGLPLPDFLIDIKDIRDLDYINYDETRGLKIGALTTIDSIEKSPLIQSKFGVLAQAASVLGTPAIRNRATIGGNLCNAAPSADTTPALIALGAKLKINGVGRAKVVSVEDFFTGPGQTVLGSGQILTEIQIPPLAPGSAGVYLKQTRRRGADLAIVGVAAIIRLEADTLAEVKLALGAVAPTAIRAEKAEQILKGKKLTDRLLEEAAEVASSESRPIDDVRSSAEYRKKLVSVLVKRAVAEAVKEARGEA